jgi:FlaG/FlaF family flagellin (archaellin)
MVAFNVEGKRHKKLHEDCQAVSEVMGQVLMIAMVVLAFSSIAVVIFLEVVVNPPHTPHTDLQADLQDNITDPANYFTLYIFHVGGEDIDLKDVKIVGQQENFTDLRDKGRDPEGKKLDNGILMLGDHIEIDIPKNKVNPTSSDTVKIYFVYTPSQQVIQIFTFYM